MQASSFQYQVWASPLFGAEVLVSDWMPTYPLPVRVRRQMILGGEVGPFAPAYVVVGVSGEDKIHLGALDSLGVTGQPTIGGWQAW